MSTGSMNWWWGQNSESKGSGATASSSSRSTENGSSNESFNMIRIDSNDDETNRAHGISSRSKSPDSSGLGIGDDRIYYGDPDYVTNSQEGIASTLNVHKEGSVQAKGSFDLERWWLRSSFWRRLLPFLLIIFFLEAIFQLLFGLYCLGLIAAEWEAVPDPYVCDTPGCVILSEKLLECINTAADPCEDFYDYGCGLWRDESEDPEVISEIIDLNHAFEIYSESHDVMLSDILKPIGKGDKTDKLIEFYKACLDERSRLAIGLDPLLRIARKLTPAAFENTVLTVADIMKDVSNTAKLYGETGIVGHFYLPDHKIALTQPEWVRDHSRTFQDILLKGRAEYEQNVASFYKKLWTRMQELGLIKNPPYPAAEAAELVVIMINGVLNYVYNPNVPLPAYTQADADSGWAQHEALLKGFLDNTFDPSVPPSFQILPSELPLERYAFGTWKKGVPGSLVILFAPDGRLFEDLTSKRRVPKPASEFQPALGRALRTNNPFMFSIICRIEIVIRPEHWVEYGLEQVFPHRFEQDSQRYLYIEAFCLTSTVFYLNTLTQVRITKIIPKDKLEETRAEMVELHINTIQGLRRWYALRDRTGELAPRLDVILREFVSVNTRVDIQFPLPEPSAENRKRLKRQVGYLDTWHVDPVDYLKSIHELTGFLNEGRLRDWKNNKLTPGENHRINLDYVSTDTNSIEALTYHNRINFPLLLLEPPYFLNNMSLFDYSGSAIFLVRAGLRLWTLNTHDPGGLGFPAGLLEGLDSGTSGIEDCTAVTGESLSGDQSLSFTAYLTGEGGEGLNALAFKVAFDLYKNPDAYRSLIDIRTGEPSRLIVNGDGSAEFITPHFFENGSHTYRHYVQYPNKTSTFGPVDPNLFIAEPEFHKYRLQFKSLVNLEHYTTDQLFFLHSINGICESSHGRDNPKFQRHTRLLNGIFQQMEEFAEAFGCIKDSLMNPPNKCFRKRVQD